MSIRNLILMPPFSVGDVHLIGKALDGFNDDGLTPHEVACINALFDRVNSFLDALIGEDWLDVEVG